MDPNADETARKQKAAENPLVSYFGGQPKPQPMQGPTATAPIAAAQTNVGQASQQPANNTGTPPPAAPQQRAPQPSTFTNFSRVLGANRAVANREAGNYADQARARAEQAAAALRATQQRFSGDVAKGTVNGAQQDARDAPIQTEIDPDLKEAQRIWDQQVFNAGQGGASMPRNPRPGGPAVDDGSSQQTRTVLGGDLSSVEMQAKADSAYSGPGGLGDVEGIGDTTAQSLAAQQNLDALGQDDGVQALIDAQRAGGSEGASKFSASLIGNAGRRGFDALRARFNPHDELEKAQTQAETQAKAAGDTSKKNATEWGELAKTKAVEEKRDAAVAKARAEGKTEQDAAAAKAKANHIPTNSHEYFANVDLKDPKAVEARTDEVKRFWEAMKTDAGDMVRDIINTTSPSQGIAEATGNRNPLGDYFTENFHKDKGAAGGSTHGDKIPWTEDDFWVFRQMDDAQWTAINKLPHNRQKEWIEKRNDELRANQKTASSTPGRVRQ